jgi:hypothetical protein
MSERSLGFDPAHVHLDGAYGMRLRKALQRISLDDVMDEEFIIQDALPDQKRIRIHQRFNGDISGRYLGLYAQAVRFREYDEPRLRRHAERLFAVQNDDGSFGYRLGTDVFYPKIYGNGRMLLGLAHYYRLTADPRALRAAHGLVGYYRSIHDGALTHEDARSQAFYFQVLDGLVSLYALDPSVDLKRSINSIADAVWDEPRNHAHSYLTTLRALADWELLEPDAARRTWLFDRWREAQAGATLDGSFTEVFPDKPRNEGCTIADWLGLHLRLWQLTGDDAMLDAAENIWLNALYTNQFENFGFGHRYYLGGTRRLGYITEGTEAWWCCSYHGPLALLDLKRYLFTRSRENALQINFFAHARLESGPLPIAMETTYPDSGSVRFRALDDSSGEVALSIRLPGFADARSLETVVVARDGSTEHDVGTIQDRRLCVARVWSAGDELHVEMPMPVRLVDPASGAPVDAQSAHAATVMDDVAIRRGPLFLGAVPVHEFSLDDQLLELPRSSLLGDGSLVLPSFDNSQRILYSGFRGSADHNVYHLWHPAAHYGADIASASGATRAELGSIRNEGATSGGGATGAAATGDGHATADGGAERLDRIGPIDLKPVNEQTDHRSDVRYRFDVRFVDR